jgi:group I intron endonuclease
MMKTGIYKITSPSGRIYIGQSVDIDKRFLDYKKLRCKKQYIIYNSIIKYGFESHKFEIICLCKLNELNDIERYYQDLYNVMSVNGMNLRLTTATDRVGVLSKEIKEKISKTKKGNCYLSDDAKIHLSKINKGKVFSQETKNKISIKKKGITFSEDHKAKLSLAKKGRKLSEDTKNKMSLSHKKRLGI